jgi:CheY-like chemotaxis protein
VIINAADANLRQYLNDTLRAREQQTTVLVPTDGDALVDNLLGLPTAPSVVVINGNDCLTTVDRVRQLGMNNLTVIAITASGEHSDQTYLTAGASAVLSDTTSPTVMVDVILSAADQPHTAYVAR